MLDLNILNSHCTHTHSMSRHLARRASLHAPQPVSLAITTLVASITRHHFPSVAVGNSKRNKSACSLNESRYPNSIPSRVPWHGNVQFPPTHSTVLSRSSPMHPPCPSTHPCDHSRSPPFPQGPSSRYRSSEICETRTKKHSEHIYRTEENNKKQKTVPIKIKTGSVERSSNHMWLQRTLRFQVVNLSFRDVGATKAPFSQSFHS
jgi:hypothetical protein